MSITNNKFKSTTVYGKFVVADTPDGSITADTILNRNLTVVGKINNIPSETINYISNLTSDVQGQINVSGGLSKTNAWTNTNTFNTSIPTTTLTPNASNQFITKAYADAQYVGSGLLSGTNTWTGTNAFNTNLPTSTLTPNASNQLVTKAYADTKASLSGDNTFTGAINTFKTVKATGTIWTDIQSQGYYGGIGQSGQALSIHSQNEASIGTTYANTIKFYCHNTSKVEQNIFNLGPTSATLNGSLTITGTNGMTTGGVIYNDLLGKGYFTQMYHNNQVFSILSRNDFYNGATGTQLETGINFYCYDATKAQKEILTLNATGAVLNGALYANTLHSVNGLTTWDSNQPANTSYANYIYQGGSIMTILVRNINLTTPTATQLQFLLYDAAKNQQNPMTINPTSVNITGSLSVSNALNFDSTTTDKINFYNTGSSATSYIMGVSSDTLYYNAGGSTDSHKFYTGGTSTTPLLKLNLDTSEITTPLIISDILRINALAYAQTIQFQDMGANPNPFSFGTITQRGTSLDIQSKNFQGNGGGATTINFKPETSNGGIVTVLSLSSSAITANKDLTVNGGTTINGNLSCPNGNGIYGNAFQAQSATNAVSLATNLTSGTGLTIGSSATPTAINGSTVTITGGITLTLGTALTLPSTVYTPSTLQLGYTNLSTSAINSNVSSGSSTYYGSVTVPSYGVWMITSKISYGAASTISNAQIGMIIVYDPIPTQIQESNNSIYSNTLPAGVSLNIQTNPYINSNLARTFKILVDTQGGSGTYSVGAYFLRATRIG